MAARMMQRVHFWNSMTHRERSLSAVFETLRVKAANHGIPNCILEEAKYWYKRMSETRITRGAMRSALIACSIYVACKANDVPRSIKEVASIFDVGAAAMTRASNMFMELVTTPIPHSRPIHFVSRFCCRLELDVATVRLCEAVVRRAEEVDLMAESTPPSVVSGAISFSCTVTGEQCCRKRIAEVCQVSVATLNRNHKRLEAHRGRLLLPLLPAEVQGQSRRVAGDENGG